MDNLPEFPPEFRKQFRDSIDARERNKRRRYDRSIAAFQSLATLMDGNESYQFAVNVIAGDGAIGLSEAGYMGEGHSSDFLLGYMKAIALFSMPKAHLEQMVAKREENVGNLENE